MYKTKDKEGRKIEKKRRSWGSRRSSYRQGIRQQWSKQATVQMELPGKVCDLCQICNWARTVTIIMCVYCSSLLCWSTFSTLGEALLGILMFVCCLKLAKNSDFFVESDVMTPGIGATYL